MAFTTRDVEYLEREIFVFYAENGKDEDLKSMQWFTVHLKGVHLNKSILIENHLPSMQQYDKLLNVEISGRDWLEAMGEAYMIIAKGAKYARH